MTTDLRLDFSRYENDPGDLQALMHISDVLHALGQNETSLLIAEYLLSNQSTPDHLMIAAMDRLRTVGYRSKSNQRRKLAASAADRMNFDRRVKRHDHYRKEFYWYRKSIIDLCPGAAITPVTFVPPTEYFPCNPSIHRHQGQLRMSLRTVNYDHENGGATIDGSYRYMTRNWILALDDDLNVTGSGELSPHPDIAPGTFHGSTGFEDLRLFTWRDELWCSFSSWDFDETPFCRMVRGRISQNEDGSFFLVDHQVMIPKDVPSHMYEKNWIPFVADDRLRFVYKCDPVRILDEHANTVMLYEPKIAAENFRGSTQMIPFGSGWLTVVHEVYIHSSPPCALYVHRLIWFDGDLIMRKCSPSFYFIESKVEFATGIEYTADASKLIISFGHKDKSAHIAVIPVNEIDELLGQI